MLIITVMDGGEDSQESPSVNAAAASSSDNAEPRFVKIY
jgi:hypothetical protein